MILQSPYYISLSGKYGSSVAEYLTLSDVLQDMDRLGIWQTTATCLREMERVLEALEEFAPVGSGTLKPEKKRQNLNIFHILGERCTRKTKMASL